LPPAVAVAEGDFEISPEPTSGLGGKTIIRISGRFVEEA
jgi:hypothetical protein